MTRLSSEAFDASHRDTLQTLMAAAHAYRDDPDFRARIEADPRGVLEERDVEIKPDDIEVRLAVNTPEVFHLVLPADPNAALSDSALRGIAGGSSVSTAGTAGTASTASSFISCVGTGGSLSSGATGGTASAS